MPVGIVNEVPGPSSAISSWSPSLRYMRPFPETMYQTSSTVRCATAFDTAFGGSEKEREAPTG